MFHINVYVWVLFDVFLLYIKQHVFYLLNLLLLCLCLIVLCLYYMIFIYLFICMWLNLFVHIIWVLLCCCFSGFSFIKNRCWLCVQLFVDVVLLNICGFSLTQVCVFMFKPVFLVWCFLLVFKTCKFMFKMFCLMLFNYV